MEAEKRKNREKRLKQKLKDAEVDTRVIPAARDQELVRWIGEHFLGWGPHGVIVEDDHGEDEEGGTVTGRPGWLLVKWPDGMVTVCSPRSARRVFEPVGD